MLLSVLLLSAVPQSPGVLGYYREPTLHGNTVVFCAEGDLWVTQIDELGPARRLTSHAGSERAPALSPDGTEVAFSATYDGPVEVYVMPVRGGLPERLTWERESSMVVGWTPDGDVLYSTSRYAGLPDPQLIRYDRETNERHRIPLAQASDGAYDASGETLFFVRPGFHRNNTRRYQGGTARDLWRWSEGDAEAQALTPEFPREDHSPMVRGDRVIWVTDRSGMMNLWSMAFDGTGVRELTSHVDWDVKDPALDASGASGRVVYQLGADLWIHDLDGGESRRLDVTLQTDLEQLAEKWETDPIDYLTHMAIDRTGERIALTARGRAFVFPVKHGRRLQVDRRPGTRYRDATFLDDERVLLLSDETGEVEFETRPVDGIGEPVRLSKNGTTLRFEGIPSPAASHIAFENKDDELRILDVQTGEETIVSTNQEGIRDFAWSPAGDWLCYSQASENTFTRLWLYELSTGTRVALTSDRTNSRTPAFSPDGHWLYFLSDRRLQSEVRSPWGPRQPEPYFDRTIEVYQIALQEGLRPSFWPVDELTEAEQEPKDKGDTGKGEENGVEEASALEVQAEGIGERIWRVPVEAGNYRALVANGDALFMLSAGDETDLVGLKIEADPEPKVIASGVRAYELSGDGKKLLIRKGGFHVVPAKAAEAKLTAKSRVDVSDWSFPISLREDYRQIFIDAWRLERDYFYDPGMHGLDWEGVRDKYLPLVDRVTTRDDLSHLIGEVVAELSALHVSVRGGDLRMSDEDTSVGALGARLRRDESAGGYVIEHIYRHDPELPATRSPLADPYHAVEPGAVILAVNGRGALSVPDIGDLLREKAGRPARRRMRT
ncbi:MAG: PDZ domain-containing protein, partial [Planctomycetota bacterium]